MSELDDIKARTNKALVKERNSLCSLTQTTKDLVALIRMVEERDKRIEELESLNTGLESMFQSIRDDLRTQITELREENRRLRAKLNGDIK